MASSTHKYVIFTAMGCAGAVVVALVVVVVATQHEGGGFGRLMREEPSTFRSSAAVDSLAAVRAWYRRPANAGGAFALRPRGSGDGAPIALAVWRDTVGAAWRPFGDTFPHGSRQYQSWGRNVASDAVDSLLAAARRPWRTGWSPLAAPDAGQVWRGLLSPVVVVSSARELMSGARLEEQQGRRARADSMVRAVVTLGRRLQEDVAMPHVALGLRLERDALHVLAGMYGRWGRSPASDSARAAEVRADERLPPALAAALGAARAAAAMDLKGRIESSVRYRMLAQTEWLVF